MGKIVDISVALRSEMPVWPDSVGLRLTRTMALSNGEVANVSKLECDVHVGTHVDAPAHFVEGGATTEEMALDVLVGPALVVGFPGADSITAQLLEEAVGSADVDRLLCKTRNSEAWARGTTSFDEDFVALTRDAAEWVVERGVRLIGVDYLSVQRFTDGPETHQVLLGAETVIVEGLDLSAVEPGLHELYCLPLKLVGADGAPARAILRTASEGETTP